MVDVLYTRIDFRETYLRTVDFRDMHFDVQKGYVKFGVEAL